MSGNKEVIMKTKKIFSVALLMFVMLMMVACGETSNSDSKQREQQEKILEEATAQTGMPAIKNFRERKLLKVILELRDHEGLITYTYLENMNPVIVRGFTALGGKLTFLGESIGYGIPYATQYTNPEKPLYTGRADASIIPQADPNGLFSPASAEGTWIILRDPSSKDAKPIYVEPRIVVFPFKLKFD